MNTTNDYMAYKITSKIVGAAQNAEGLHGEMQEVNWDSVMAVLYKS